MKKIYLTLVGIFFLSINQVHAIQFGGFRDFKYGEDFCECYGYSGITSLIYAFLVLIFSSIISKYLTDIVQKKNTKWYYYSFILLVLFIGVLFLNILLLGILSIY